MAERKRRVVISDNHRFKHSREDVFKLLCPVKEDDWLPGWKEQKKMVCTESGLAELGCVFITKNWPHLMGSAVWVNNIYMPSEKIQYSAVSENIVYQSQCDLKSTNDGCDAVVTRTWTALTPAAEEFLGKMGENVKQKGPDLFKLLDHYLSTGKMLSF